MDQVWGWLSCLQGLEVCADTIVGNAMLRGISGGQRKRVTTCSGLVSKHSAILWHRLMGKKVLAVSNDHYYPYSLRRPLLKFPGLCQQVCPPSRSDSLCSDARHSLREERKREDTFWGSKLVKGEGRMDDGTIESHCKMLIFWWIYRVFQLEVQSLLICSKHIAIRASLLENPQMFVEIAYRSLLITSSGSCPFHQSNASHVTRDLPFRPPLHHILLHLHLLLLPRRTTPGASTSHACGVDPHVLTTCPVTYYSTIKMRTPQNPAFQCAVCLEEFDDADDALHLLPKCGHMFHAHCIDAWLSSVLLKKIEHRKNRKKIN
ncbi:hypothetical protein JHK86_015982 [Glycine max]|nr:hypothetical protein JHK86_015982 [Glycine max]